MENQAQQPEQKKRLKLQCPFCETLYDVTELKPGTKILCAECDHTMLVPDKLTTRRISETELHRMREQEKAEDKDVPVLELDKDSSGDMPAAKQVGPKQQQKKDWIDWKSLRDKKGPEKK
ncbi:MAG: hypothetical protein HY720_25930 [Planctomycetes bacterium]|nr:hypothetical protein [Planctomycetota bacterium]